MTTTKVISKRTALNNNVNAYILNAIDSEGYNVELSTDAEKLQFLANCYKQEYSFPDNLKRYKTHQNCFANWLMGLPSCFNVDYTYIKIIGIAKEWQSIPENATTKHEDKITDNWFPFIAAKTMQLMSKNNVYLY